VEYLDSITVKGSNKAFEGGKVCFNAISKTKSLINVSLKGFLF